MSEIIKDAWVEENIYYTLDFNLKEDPGAGYTFPCNEKGIVEKMNPAAEESYEYVKANLNKYFSPKLQKHIDHYRHRPTIKCDCGEEFELNDMYYGSCDCPKCGQWYNLFGQKTLSPDEYRDHDDFDDGEYDYYH